MGNIYPSVVHNKIMGNIAQNNFKNIWESNEANIARQFVDSGQIQTWMICTARAGMKKYPLKPIIWIIKNKIKAALTDEIGGKNLLGLFEQFSDDHETIKKFNTQFKNKSIKYSELKPLLADVIIQTLKPIREKRAYYEKNPKIVEKILFDGTKKARQLAKQTLKKVKEKMFIDYFKKTI